MLFARLLYFLDAPARWALSKGAFGLDEGGDGSDETSEGWSWPGWEAVAPCGSPGSVLFYDARILHRGLGNERETGSLAQKGVAGVEVEVEGEEDERATGSDKCEQLLADSRPVVIFRYDWEDKRAPGR